MDIVWRSDDRSSELVWRPDDRSSEVVWREGDRSYDQRFVLLIDHRKQFDGEMIALLTGTLFRSSAGQKSDHLPAKPFPMIDHLPAKLIQKSDHLPAKPFPMIDHLTAK